MAVVRKNVATPIILVYNNNMVILNGKALSEKLKQQIKTEVEQIGKPIKLVCVLVGDNPASKIYVRNKQKASA